MFGWPSCLRHKYWDVLNSFHFFGPSLSLIAAIWMLWLFHRSPRAVPGSIPGRKWPFFNTLQHPCHLCKGVFMGVIKDPRGMGKCGTLSKSKNGLKLFSKKSFKIELFKNASWKFKNISPGVYPHQTRALYTLVIPPNVKGHYPPPFVQGVLSIYTPTKKYPPFYWF